MKTIREEEIRGEKRPDWLALGCCEWLLPD
jgi:hypothetical protein